MGRNVFVSYKYGDNNVKQFDRSNHPTSSRDYVNVIMKILGETNFYYYNGEYDGYDLSQYPEDFIREKLYNKIFYTSITIILLTANMRKYGIPEKNQWIPQEISYSLRNKNRQNGYSNMNAVLCVVIPDKLGNYGHTLRRYSNGDVGIKENNLFKIISENLFNNIRADHFCYSQNQGLYEEGKSYFALATWDEFCKDPEYYLQVALDNRGHWQDFQIRKTIDESW